MPNSKSIAKRLFLIAAADLTELRPETVDEVVCPLCLARFGIDAVEDGRLSREHIVPSALGGKLLTLTCRLCNNTLGSDLDRHLVNAMRGLEFDPEMYRRAVFRSAYLAAYERLGYPYVFCAQGEYVRQIIQGLEPAPEVVREACPVPEPKGEACVIPATKERPFIQVTLRMRSAQTFYLTVHFPA